MRYLRFLRDKAGKHLDRIFRVVCYFFILLRVKPRAFLGKFGGSAISSDMANILISKILKTKAKLVLEAGSGLSTILMGYALEKTGGILISLEHDKKFYEKTLADIRLHKLKNVKLIYAPLQIFNLEGKEWLWYCPEGLKEIESIDILFVDGPPGSAQPLSRYPALPILKDKISNSCTIILDDFFRKDEREIVNIWKSCFFDFELTIYKTQKGTAILRR